MVRELRHWLRRGDQLQLHLVRAMPRDRVGHLWVLHAKSVPRNGLWERWGLECDADEPRLSSRAIDYEEAAVQSAQEKGSYDDRPVSRRDFRHLVQRDAGDVCKRNRPGVVVVLHGLSADGRRCICQRPFIRKNWVTFPINAKRLRTPPTSWQTRVRYSLPCRCRSTSMTYVASFCGETHRV